MSSELYSEQDVITKVIVPGLASLDYDDALSQVELRYQNPILAQQGRERKTIYADIVVYVNNVPVIVVDGKNPRKYLTDNDRAQVISYARLIGEVAPYAVLSNGHTWEIYDSVTKIQLAKLPALDALIADMQRRRLSPRQRQSLRNQAERTLFAIDSARELSRLMHRCHDVIRNKRGYDPTRAFDELSKLLFAKMYEERELAEGRRPNNRFTLNSVRAMREEGVDIIQRLWQETIQSEHYREVFSDQDATEIELPPDAIDEIVEILQDKSLGLTDLDVKGVAFEEFLAATYRGGGLGQFFTPREVVNFMVDLIEPAIGETVIDPACGTGGFLIRVYDVVSEKIIASELSEAEKASQLNDLANSSLVGIDWEPRAARTCKMNMIIHGDGHAGVYQANALALEEIANKVEERQRFYPSAPDIQEGAFDVVLTNPPFGARDSASEILADYDLGRGASQKREVLMIERCIRLLRPGGRVAIVVPEGILSNKTDNRIRDFIKANCIIKAIIRLPQDAFKMSEGAACTSILYLVKKDPDNPNLATQGDLFLARAEHIGISPSGRPISENDLVDIREHFRYFESGDWDGIELRALQNDEQMEIVRSIPGGEGVLWLEPEVNRTSLLYDRLSYVVRDPKLTERFGYTYYHPRYYEIMTALANLPAEVRPLQSLCKEGFPRRGKKPSEDSSDGIAVLKVRNITGQGIDFESDYAPDTEEIRQQCERAFVQKYDLLITSTGEGTIGRVDVYLPDESAIVDSHITICRLRRDVNWRYVMEFLKSENGQIQMLRHVSGSTGQTELLLDHVRTLSVPLPPAEVQAEIVERMGDAQKVSTELQAQASEMQKESANVIALGRKEMLDLLEEE